MTDEELISKFKANASSQLSESRMNAIVDATFAVDEFTVADYVELLISNI
jgi:hypothetical protein